MERHASSKVLINNSFYDHLHEKWYEADDHPIALLRAENKTRIPWITQEIEKKFSNAAILDIGCGAGFLTNALAKSGHQVTGVDISQESLIVAKAHDSTHTVQYIPANAYQLPFASHSFNAVCAMDILEHIEEPKLLIREAKRILKPGGLFFFHTFNRNYLSYIIAIKGIEWFVKNTPSNIHVYELFIKPKELKRMLDEEGLIVYEQKGFMPKLNLAFFEMLYRRVVPKEFAFTFTSNCFIGYCGIAELK